MDLDSLDNLPTDDLKAIFLRVQDIIGRRSIIESAPIEMARLARDVLEAEGVQPGDPWRAPTAAHDAYPEGWTVTHDGHLWESLITGNAHEPGISGWRIRATDDQPAPWVQPSGAHDDYQAGALVTHDGHTWRSDIDGNVWEPGVHGWTRIEQED